MHKVFNKKQHTCHAKIKFTESKYSVRIQDADATILQGLRKDIYFGTPNISKTGITQLESVPSECNVKKGDTNSVFLVYFLWSQSTLHIFHKPWSL